LKNKTQDRFTVSPDYRLCQGYWAAIAKHLAAEARPWSSTVPLAAKARIALLPKSQAMTGRPKPFSVDDGQNPFMSRVEGTQINFNDWGTGQPVVFRHGWPLTL
jgi:hypothetical protein